MYENIIDDSDDEDVQLKLRNKSSSLLPTHSRGSSHINAMTLFAYQGDTTKGDAFASAFSNMQINKEDWHTRAILGLYLVHLGEQVEGTNLLETAIKQSQRNPEILYFKALAVLQEDDTEQAISLLEEAVALEQYYQQFIVLDPDLKRLQDDPRFIALLPTIEQ